MSRRVASGADRAEQNRATLKQLVKLESNKSCADCKRNKHPRWASWNIGVFVCIRCSGIHRGMGTHISRVKSVDLDSWTDEQMQNMLRWGNARANKYWENKLAEGHVPNEAKIENFIRTKYDSKRWAMDGPMPDPSTLDDGSGDDDVPLNVVREKALGERDRSASLRNGSGTMAPPPTRSAAPNVDLFGDDEPAAPARPSTTEPVAQRSAAPKAPAAPPKSTKPGESLLGLDFFGGTPSAPPARPSSTGPSTTGVPGRADLKSSILSLYASKPAPPPQSVQPQQQPQSNLAAFAGMQSPPLASPTHPQANAPSFGGMTDAFGSLSFTSPGPPAAKPSPFANLTSPPAQTRQTSAPKASLSGGSFFDTKPPLPPTRTAQQSESLGADWGDFSSGAAPPALIPKSPPATTSGMGNLFDISAPAPPPKPAAAPPPPAAFNLSSPQTHTQTQPPLSNFPGLDAWGSNDAWASPDPPPQPLKPAPAPSFDSGWGEMVPPAVSAAKPAANPQPAVQPDEEFGGWSHASPVAAKAGAGFGGGGGGGGGGSDDLFGNVWE